MHEGHLSNKKANPIPKNLHETHQSDRQGPSASWWDSNRGQPNSPNESGQKIL